MQTLMFEEALSKLPAEQVHALRRVDQLWQSLRDGTLSLSAMVSECATPIGPTDWDVVIAGGTLGILLGTTLVMRGWRVALLERGILRGRAQEWNTSRRELQVLLELELLSELEWQQTIASEYNPGRISFHGGPDLWVRDVLNIGVDPVFLLDKLKHRFLAFGGHLLENTGLAEVIHHPNGVVIRTESLVAAPYCQVLTTRLLLDAMGHFSPIARQARGGRSPDAVCLVVGSCAQGFRQNDTGDLLVSFTPIRRQCQYFWEAFPARDGRTTYLFTYLDAHPDRPSLQDLVVEYLSLLPTYQQTELDALQWQRILGGVFPCYRNSPLQLPWSHMLAIGDSSGNQSPLSFGGFGAMLRHLQRLTVGIDDALRTDALTQQDLALLQPYQPNISVTWLFQRAMSVGIYQTIQPNQINRLLVQVFETLAAQGDDVLKPFLQDVVQFGGLSSTLLRTSLSNPMLVAEIIPQVGLSDLVKWVGHYLNLGLYTGLYEARSFFYPILHQVKGRYHGDRWLEGLKYGSGRDFGVAE